MRKLAMILTLLPLAACGGDEAATPDPQAAVTQTPEPVPVEPEISVSATEYEFQGIPDELTRGHYTFRLENAGEEPHELSLARVTTDTPLEELLQLPGNEAQQQLEDAGRAFSEAGAGDTLEAELEAGRYAYVCFVEAPDGTPHAFLGMVGEFSVT